MQPKERHLWKHNGNVTMFVVDYHYPNCNYEFQKTKDNTYWFILILFVLFNFFIENTGKLLLKNTMPTRKFIKFVKTYSIC